MSFIEKVVHHLHQKKGEYLASSVVVFPNRRAGLFFKQALSRYIAKPVWVPRVLSIREFIEEVTSYRIPEELTLLMELYETYRSLGIDEAFDSFYPWGGLLLRDFDEIDKYLVSGEEVFRNLAEVKRIEEQFSFDEEQKSALKHFWSTVDAENQSPFQQAFLSIWETNRQLYTAFQNRLKAKQWAYEGMAYREIAEHPESCDAAGWDYCLFAGFNALSPAEKAIIQYFIDQEKGEILWDADHYYLDDERQEAGFFLRKQFQQTFSKPDKNWIENRLSEEAKNVKVFGVPLDVGQAKALGNILEKQKHQFDPEKTAIVLQDEGLLFPVLNALPERYQDINVTMGYPLRNTPFFSLFESLIKMQQEASGGSNDKQYYFRVVLNVLQHAFIHAIAPDTIDQRKQQIHENNEIFIRARDLQQIANEEEDDFSRIFQPVEDLKGVFAYFRQLILIVQNQLEQGEEAPEPVEQAYLYQFYTYLNRLDSLIEQYDIDFQLDTFWSLFRQIIQTQQIPFNGEPLTGLQVMGMLETRNLDFENIFILSANEGQMPPANDNKSFIPFNIRKAFGLPTYEEEDALFAYHFYRLLQRAKNIYFFYDTEMGTLNKGEKSRYLYQLESEWRVANPNLQWQEHLLKAPMVNEAEKPITIPKTGEVWEQLNRYLTEDPAQKPRSLSPSALLTYMACPLQFYFRYIAGLEEEEEVTEDIKPDTLGSIFHDAIAHLYEIHLQKWGAQVSEESLNGLYNEIDEALDTGLKNHYSADLSNLKGKNLLIRSIIYRQIESVLERDKQALPFDLLLVEKGQYEAFLSLGTEGEAGGYVRLKGIIDRMDEQNGVKRVLDYKTGEIHYNTSQGIEDFFTSSRNKTAFQLLWYGYVYHQNHPEEAITLGAYPLKQVNQPIQYLFKGRKLTDEDFSAFENGLNDQLASLFDPNVPFSQTDDLKICEQCPYNRICHR